MFNSNYKISSQRGGGFSLYREGIGNLTLAALSETFLTIETRHWLKPAEGRAAAVLRPPVQDFFGFLRGLILPDSRPFPQPKALEPAAAFWRDVFLARGKSELVFHDRENLGVIWRVVSNPIRSDVLLDNAVAEFQEQKIIQQLAERLQRLATDPTPRDDEDHALLAATKGNLALLKGAAERLRAQRGMRENFQHGYMLYQALSMEIKSILRSEKVPEELAALPFVESMYNNDARSKVGAAGMWQLMPEVAREFGLRVDDKVDERFDVRKATRAAARLLKRNQKLLGAWPLAITAYNHGAKGLLKATQQLGTRDIEKILANYSGPNWGFASKNFYVEFLAAMQIVAMTELGHKEHVEWPHTK